MPKFSIYLIFLNRRQELDDQALIHGFLNDDFDGVGFGPLRIDSRPCLPTVVVLDGAQIDGLLGIPPRLHGIFLSVVVAQIIGFFLENDLGQPFAPHKIHAFGAGGVVRGHFLTFQDVQRGPGDVGQMFLQDLVVLLLLTAAALQIGIQQVIVGNIQLIAALTAAMPDYAALTAAIVCRVHRQQTMKLLAGDVGKAFLPAALAAAVSFTAGDQQCSGDITFCSAAAAAGPPYTTIAALVGRLAQDCQILKCFARQDMPAYLLPPQTAAAQRSFMPQASLQYTTLGAALAST